jgi:DNA-binding NarL/FixJ family response regulator
VKSVPFGLLLVDDHRLFRESLRSLISQTSDIEAIAQASDGKEVLDILAILTPDLIVISTNELNAVWQACVVRLAKLYPTIPILVLSLRGTDDLYCAQEALPSNVKAHLLKEVEPEVFLHTVRKVCAASNDERTRLGTPRCSFRPEKLTRQEIVVLRLMITGLSNEQIAARLSNSIRTIEGHRRSIYHKTDTDSLIGLVSFALEHHIVTPTEFIQLARKPQRVS